MGNKLNLLNRMGNISFGLGLLCICFLIGRMSIRLREPKVDLPEEYKAISTDINNPDTFTVYQHNDIIYFQFK